MTVPDIRIARFIDRLRVFLNDPEAGALTADNLERSRELFTELLALRFEGSGRASDILAEVYDCRRERVKIIRTPHPHMIRDPYGTDGASLSEAMDSIELLMQVASEAVRGIAGEVSHQETERQFRARHVARCEPVRRWGEKIATDHPRLSRILITFAGEAQAPTMLTEAESDCLGFSHDLATSLLAPERFEDLTEHLIEMAKVKITNS